MGYEVFARYYDELTANIDYKALAGYYDSLILSRGGKRGILLDLACGTGSLSREMSLLGYDVIGVDLSQEMLSIAASKEHKGIEYLCQDMTKLDMYGTVTSVICSLDSINHLDGIESVRKAFERVSLFSEPGAVFIFDVNTVHKHEKVLADNTFVYETENVFCVWENEYEGDGRTYMTLDFFAAEDGREGLYRRECDEFTETAYPKEELEALIAGSGFRLSGCYEYPTLNPPAETSEKLTFVCVKEV